MARYSAYTVTIVPTERAIEPVRSTPSSAKSVLANTVIERIVWHVAKTRGARKYVTVWVFSDPKIVR